MTTGHPPAGYRLVLRAYPRRFRHQPGGAELLGIVLDDADARGRTRPSVAEALDLLSHGLRMRLSFVDLVVPTDVRTRIGQLSLVTGTVLSTLLLLFGEIHWGPSELDAEFADVWSMPHQAGPFLTVGGPVYLGWLALFATYVAGRPAATRKVAVLVGIGTVLAWTVATRSDLMRPPRPVLVLLIILSLGQAFAPVCATPSRRVRAAAAALVLVSVGSISWWHLAALTTDQVSVASRLSTYWIAPDVHDWLPTTNLRVGDGLWSALMAFSLPIVLVGAVLALAAWPRDRTWLPAIAIVGGCWLAATDGFTPIGPMWWSGPDWAPSAGSYFLGGIPQWAAIRTFAAVWVGTVVASLVLHRLRVAPLRRVSSRSVRPSFRAR